MKILITGGCGFLGSNLAAAALDRGTELMVFDNLSRTGSTANLEWLRGKGEFTHVHGDIRNPNDVARLVRDFRRGVPCSRPGGDDHFDRQSADGFRS